MDLIRLSLLLRVPYVTYQLSQFILNSDYLCQNFESELSFSDFTLIQRLTQTRIYLTLQFDEFKEQFVLTF